MQTGNLRREDSILLGLAVFLVIDLLLIPWVSAFGLSVAGTEAPDSALGVLALIATLLYIAYLAAERFSPQTQLPSIGGSAERTKLVLAGLALAFIALKTLLEISHLGDFGIGWWLGLIVGIALVVLTAQPHRIAGPPTVR